MRYLQVESGKFLAMAYSPDGRYLATGHGDGVARLWSTATAEVVAEAKPETSRFATPAVPKHAAFLTGNRFVMLHHDGGNLWEITETNRATLKATQTYTHPINLFNGGYVIIPHPEGDRFFVVTGSLFWEQRLGWGYGWAFLLARQMDAPLYSAAIHPTGKTMVTSSVGPFVDVWELSSLVALSDADTDRIWRRGIGSWPDLAAEPIIRLRTEVYNSNRLHFDTEGDRLIGVASDRVRTWNVATWEPSGEFPLIGMRIRAAAVSPDGRTILVATADREVVTYDLDSGWERGRFAFDIGKLGRLAVSPDGTTAAAGGGGKRLAIWDID